jgi:thermitase
MIIPLLFIVTVVSIQLLKDEKNSPSPRPAPQPIQNNNRFNVINTVRVQNEKNKPHTLQINSIEAGETIKDHLRHDPSIVRIKHNAKDESHYHHDQVTVKFKSHPSDTDLEQMLKDISGKVLNNLDTTIVFQSDRLETSELIAYFSKRENVEYTEPVYIYLQNQLNLPNDILYTEQYQWNLPVIQTEAGWDVTRGNEKVVIAIVDTGVDLNHPDLKNRLTKGYNVIENTNFPDDDNGHGTHVAGIIASETNNQEGGAGITWYNKIMPIKAMGPEGYGTSFDIAKGVIWAVEHGANVINLSLGNYQPSKLMKDAVKYAFDRNVVIVAAAGNDNSNQTSYPAAYPEVIGVSAMDYTGMRASFSNYGDYIDVTAPGVQIPSTYFNQQYAALSGTSMATPHVAGLAGLIFSANPKLSNHEVINIIKNTAYDLGTPGDDFEFGHGLIDVKEALDAARKK